MAELLIRKRKHFAEDGRPTTWSEQKWVGRPQRGDVVDVRPDGFYSIWATDQDGRGWDRNAFMLVKLTTVSHETVTELRGSPNETHRITCKNRYRVKEWADIPWTKTMRTLPDGRQLEEWYHESTTSGPSISIVDRLT